VHWSKGWCGALVHGVVQRTGWHSARVHRFTDARARGGTVRWCTDAQAGTVHGWFGARGGMTHWRTGAQGGGARVRGGVHWCTGTRVP
jgi:hypothetical protein